MSYARISQRKYKAIRPERIKGYSCLSETIKHHLRCPCATLIPPKLHLYPTPNHSHIRPYVQTHPLFFSDVQPEMLSDANDRSLLERAPKWNPFISLSLPIGRQHFDINEIQCSRGFYSSPSSP
ncbi:hypothetical protein Trydic_g2584 [Trypoxylus dichotomus]